MTEEVHDIVGEIDMCKAKWRRCPWRDAGEMMRFLCLFVGVMLESA